jgi:hypothetical protein
MVAAGFEGVVKFAHDFDGFEVDRILFLKRVLLVAGNEREMLDVTVKISERKFVGDSALFVEQRQVALFLRLQVVQRNPRKVGNDDIAGDFVAAGRVIGQIADLLKSLGLGLAQVFTE